MIHFDQLMHWVPDREAAIARCTELGFPPLAFDEYAAHGHTVCVAARP